MPIRMPVRAKGFEVLTLSIGEVVRASDIRLAIGFIQDGVDASGARSPRKDVRKLDCHVSPIAVSVQEHALKADRVSRAASNVRRRLHKEAHIISTLAVKPGQVAG